MSFHIVERYLLGRARTHADFRAARPSAPCKYLARITYSRLPDPYCTMKTNDNALCPLLENVQPSLTVS